MALEAESGAFRRKKHFHRRTVRTVARGAAAVKRRVHEFLLDLVLHVSVTGEAQLGAGFDEQACDRRLMRIVACRAIAGGRGAMDVFVVYLVGVA